MRTVFSSRKAQIQADQAQAIGRRLILEGDNNKTTTFDFGTKHNDNDDDDDDKWGLSEKFADCGRTCINGHHYKLLFGFCLTNHTHTHTETNPTTQNTKCICISCSLLRKRKCVALVFGEVVG